MRRRVIAYITRKRDGRSELLVFNDPIHPHQGDQVPAGRLEPDETLEAGLLRELEEEAGLTAATVVRELALPPRVAASIHYEQHAFEVHLPAPTPASWSHVVTGDGDDAGLVFHYRWEPLEETLLLFGSDGHVPSELV